MKLRDWYMVHGKLSPAISLPSIMAAIRPSVPDLTAQPGDPADASSIGRLVLAGSSTPVISIRRFRRDDPEFLFSREDWERELRSWPRQNADDVIEFLRQTCQSIAITPLMCPIGETRLARMCEQICGNLARTTDGLIHVFQEGFFNAEGDSLFPYNPKHRLKTT